MTTKTKPNWVEIGTLVVAAFALILSGFAAYQSASFGKIEAQINEARARAEIIHKLVIVGEYDSCSVSHMFSTQRNAVLDAFEKASCSGSDNNSNLRLAGLYLQLGGFDPIFAPRVTLAYKKGKLEGAVDLSEVLEPSSSVKKVSLGFLEEGVSQSVFVPVAIIDSEARPVYQDIVWPVSLSWVSPVTNETITLPLNWFLPREQWLANDAIVVAQ